MRRYSGQALLLILFFIATLSFAQMPMIDQGVYVEGLWCFPVHNDTTTFVYLPNRGRLTPDERGNPKFSYLRYMLDKPGEKNTGNAITTADGGGVLHFLVMYDTPEETIAKAQAALRRQMGNNEKIKIRGPIVFDKATYNVVSSILVGGKEERRLITSGEAPVMENSSIACSFSLNPTQSKLLLESFKMKNPDISVVFDLVFSGQTDGYDAEMEIDWSEVKKSEAFKAGASVYIIGADVELGFEKLKRDNAIKLTVFGNNGSLDGLLTSIYDRLLNLMFKPADYEKVSQQGGNVTDAFNAVMGAAGKRVTGFGINVGYQLKEMQMTGKSRLYFKGRSNVQRHNYITFNIGDLYQRYGSNPQYFKDVSLWDPAFQKRQIWVGIDGDIEQEFEKMINTATVFLRKKHQGGQTTLQSVAIVRADVQNYEAKTMTYGFNDDHDRMAWMNYEYQTVWQFQGGGKLETPWERSTAAMINLYTPYYRKSIYLDGDWATLESKGVKSISVSVVYSFFGKPKRETIRLRPGENLSDKIFNITLPNNIDEVDYEINWVVRPPGSTNNSIVTAKGKDKYGLVFIDEMP